MAVSKKLNLPKMNEIRDALDKIHDALAIVVAQISSFEVAFAIKNLEKICTRESR
jgi:hypothetical protein